MRAVVQGMVVDKFNRTDNMSIPNDLTNLEQRRVFLTGETAQTQTGLVTIGKLYFVPALM